MSASNDLFCGNQLSSISAPFSDSVCEHNTRGSPSDTLPVSIDLVTLRTVAPARYVAATDPTNGTTLSAAQGLTEMTAVLAGLLGHR